MENNYKKLDQYLREYRSDIDRIDLKILDLINQRLILGKKIGQIKEKKQTDVFDSSREKQVISKILKNNKGPAQEQLLKYIFNVIMTATRDIQKKQIVSFPGPEAGFCHMAALNHFKYSGRFVEQLNIYEVFRNTNRKKSHFGVVPVETFMQDSMNHTLDLFVEFDLSILAEHYEPVSYDLISLTGEKNNIKRIYTTAETFSQCKIWITNNFPNAKLIDTPNFSEAAELIAKKKDSAMISYAHASSIYSLHIVEPAIEDYPGTYNRFLIIGKDNLPRTGKDKTTIMFSTPNIPGALFKALEPVKNAGINMLKLESRPSKHENLSYYFFMDIEGHIQDQNLEKSMEKMRGLTLSLKHLGSYPVHEIQGAE